MCMLNLFTWIWIVCEQNPRDDLSQGVSFHPFIDFIRKKTRQKNILHVINIKIDGIIYTSIILEKAIRQIYLQTRSRRSGEWRCRMDQLPSLSLRTKDLSRCI